MRTNRSAAVPLAALLLLAAGCASAPLERPPGATSPAATVPTPPAPLTAPAPLPPPKPAQPEPGILGRNEEFVVVLAGPHDTARTLAARFLGAPDRAWVVEDFNLDGVAPGREVVVPLIPTNPAAVFPDGYQTVPILCYHQFGTTPSKMVVTGEAFTAQMDFLDRKGYRVLPLGELAGFLRGERQLPRKAVVLTIDDGYASTYHFAYPVLIRHRFPATVFVYTDFMGAPAALTWDQLAEMTASGLIDAQPHSQRHSNLGLAGSGETPEAYAERVRAELTAPAEVLRRRLGLEASTFAYPYGDANEFVLKQMEASRYRLGATVQAGGNPAFAPPLLLRRTMIYGEDDLAAFERKLEVFRPAALR